MRAFWETLMEVEPGRRLSRSARGPLAQPARVLPAAGLRAGGGRLARAQTWRLYPQRVVHSKNELVRAEWWILWRRLAGGLSAGQQQTLAQPLLGAFRDRIRMPGVGRPQSRTRLPVRPPRDRRGVAAALGAMELLPVETKSELATMLLDLLGRDRQREIHEAALWALGRIGGARAGLRAAQRA